MNKTLRNNSLSIAMFLLFAVSMGGQIVSGHHVFNEDRREHNQPEFGLGSYLRSAHFVEATFENWESEFLQMGAFVLLTAWLVQKGSSESKDPSERGSRKEHKRSEHKSTSRGPVHRGGLALKLYEHSLTGVLFLVFAFSFVLHAIGGAHQRNSEALEHGGQAISAAQYLGTSRFWFESFQNWQSEFFSIWALLLLTIYLREKGSPQSKAVSASNDETGE
ncbi:MAG: hypothetical protein H0U64_04290 [Gemmatimonadaceae bacterium]|nr:hypothetical protein [Gemmatimonadaceae bacterium]